VEIRPSLTFSTKRIFKSVGATGVVGLRLFKLNWPWKSLELLGGGVKPNADESKEFISKSEDWGDSIEDQLE